MGFFSTVGAMFSSDKLVDKVSSGVDKMFYTDEEKADGRERLLSLYEPFKLAQRYISLALLFIMGASWFLAIAVRLGGNMFCDPVILDGQVIKWWMDDSAWIATNSLLMFGEAFFYSVVFYFGGGAGEGIVKGLMKGKVANLTKK